MRCFFRSSALIIYLILSLIPLSSFIEAQDNEYIDSRINNLNSLQPGLLHDSVQLLLKDIIPLDASTHRGYYDRVYKISGTIGNPEIRIEILEELSLYDKQNFLKYQYEMISLCEKNKLNRRLFWTLNSIAYFYKSSNQLDSAMAYALRARSLVDHEMSNEKVSITLLIADLHYWARLYDKAELLYKEVLKLKGDSSQYREWIFTTTNNNLGMIELNRRSFSTARDYFMTSLKYRIENPCNQYDSVSIAFTYYLLGKTEFEAGNYEKAREYHDTGAPIAEKFEIMEFIFYFSLLEARLLFAEGKIEQSYQELTRSYHLLEKENTNIAGVFESKTQIATDLMTIYDAFINIHFNWGNSDSALYYYKLYQELGYKLDLSTSYAAYIQMLAEKDNEIISAMLMKSNEKRRIILAGFFIVLIFLLIMLIYTRRIIKIRKMLAAKHNELLRTNEYLIAIDKELRQSNTAKDLFFSVLAHDLKNPFSSMKGFNELLDESLRLNNLNDSREYASIIRNSTDLVYDLLTNLLDWSKIHSGHITFSSELVSVESLFKQTIKNQEFQALHKKISLKHNAEPGMKMTCDKNMMFIILRNILANALKATSENGNISLTYELTEGFHTISVKDSGCGMTAEKKDKVFGNTNNQPSTEKKYEGDSGIGIIIVKDFLNFHKGVLKVISEPGAGTEVLIIIPVQL